MADEELPRGLYRRGPVIWGSFWVEGRRVRRPLGQNVAKAIAAFDYHREQGTAPGAPIAPLRPAGPTLGAVFENYLDHVRRQHPDKPRTIENAVDAIRIRGRFLDVHEPVSAFTQADYWKFRDARAAAVRSTASANVTIRYLKAALNRGVRDNLIERLPFRIELLPAPPKRNRALSRSQVKKVLSKASDPRAHAILMIAYGLGLRLSEILHLWWGDVDLKEGWIQVESKPGWTTKTRQRRVLVLDEDLRKFLFDWRSHLGRTGPTDPVVPRDMASGVPFERRWAGELLAGVFKAAGINGGAHALRHTMVTEALEAGVPVHIVQRMAGHAAVQTTLGHYAHVRDPALRDAAVALAKKRRG